MERVARKVVPVVELPEGRVRTTRQAAAVQ